LFSRKKTQWYDVKLQLRSGGKVVSPPKATPTELEVRMLGIPSAWKGAHGTLTERDLVELDHGECAPRHEGNEDGVFLIKHGFGGSASVGTRDGSHNPWQDLHDARLRRRRC
jgi:hypothetical protein